MIYSGEKQLKAFKGNYAPVNIYLGREKLSGWQYSSLFGTSLTFASTYNDTADITVYGRSEQAQPSPSRNMFLHMPSGFPYTSAGITITYNAMEQTVTYNGTSTIDAWHQRAAYPIGLDRNIDPNAVFSWTAVSGTLTDASASNYFYLSFRTGTIQNTAVYMSPGVSTKAFALTEAIESSDNMMLGFFIPKGAVFDDYTIKFQLEYGYNASPWVEYNRVPSPDAPIAVSSASGSLVSNSTYVPIPTLRALEVLPTASDYTYELDGKRYIADTYKPGTGELVRRIGCKSFDGTENWNGYGETGINFWYTSALPDVDTAYWEYARCSHLIPLNVGTTNMFVGFIGTAAVNRMRFYENETRTLAQFKAWVASLYSSGAPLTQLYVLSGPVREELEKVSVKTFYPTTQFYTDSDTQAVLSVKLKERSV